MTRISKVLIANRGEIAVRIIATCRRMGIATVAVFSDADADAPHVRAADEAVRIGPAPSAESYLVIDRILDAAQQTGADAVHPGYGFLAENAAFATACAERGVIFIGPSPEVIRVLGSKRESKRIVGDAGVPVIPGYGGEAQDAATLAREAEKIGFPVLLKASAGGGGKGMQVVRSADGLKEAIESAKRVSASAFGDDTLLIEKYVENPRHVEIQILGDAHGHLIHLYERECSIQRRHQKIIEESPSPALDDALRAKMGAAAVTVGKAVGYVNAGTVEFILAPDGSFYFLEVNTRLQVEHPVTECLTGLDLVREQLRVAQGEHLGLEQADVPRRGAAIECRLYAEDPAEDFRPAAGRVVDWHVPDVEGLRVDAGVETGSEVGIHYDPMLAKIICHAPTRAEAIARLVYSLRAMSVQGLVTNREFLIRVLEHEAIGAGSFDTHFLERHIAEVRVPPPPPALLRIAAIAATVAASEARRHERTLLPALELGFRNNRFSDQRVAYDVGGSEIEVHYRHDRGRLAVRFGDARFDVALVTHDGPELTLELAPHAAAGSTENGAGAPLPFRRRVRVVRDGARVYVHDREGDIVLDEIPDFADPTAVSIEGGCVAPMPGKVVKIFVSEGQSVKAGAPLLILEAMKMEHQVTAPEDGQVITISVDEGEQVETDQLLVVVDSE